MEGEQLLHKQSDLGRKIHRVVENLKKSIAQSKMTKGDVQARLQLLENYWAQFQANHDILMFTHMNVVKTTDYVKEEYADVIEEAFVGQRGKLLEMLNQFQASNSSSPATASTETVELDQSTTKGSAPLPRIQLPEFHGAYVEWPAFRELFTSIMDRNKHLSNVDRLHYLKTCLRGEAADHVRDLPTINENYDRAWTILKEQYENKRILVRSCLDRLASLTKMKESSAQELTNIHKGVIAVVNSLEGLGRPITSSEDWFIYTVVNLFDPTTRDKWEERVTERNDPPSFSTLKDFITKRRQQLEASTDESMTVGNKSIQHRNCKEVGARAGNVQRTIRANHAQTNAPTCIKCRKEHFLMHCADYKALPPAERRGFVERTRLCRNCLGNHQIAACPSTKSCMSCGERHHSSLHDSFRDSANQASVCHAIDCRHKRGKVSLATAVIEVSDRLGRKHKVRALIDQGSEISMIKEGLAQRLDLSRASSNVALYGLGGRQLARARGQVTLTVSSPKAPDTLLVTAIVISKLTDYTRNLMEPRGNWKHLEGLELADPPSTRILPIEVLLGADVYAAVMQTEVRKGAPNEPYGQHSLFGWVVTGLAGASAIPTEACVHQVVVEESLGSLVRRFWEQEELQEAHSTPTAEEQECEDHFMTTHSRTPEGRYQVRLPFRKASPITSGSRDASLHALKRMERRFKRDEKFKNLYHEFISEYEQLGHMTRASKPATENQAHYLPHHGVLKLNSSTTKLRAVFNGSWTEPSQLSLNECLHVGPNLLPLLSDILLRWRRHRYVVTADVTKMYRQILVHPDDRDHQRILWRNNETQQVSEFRLNTVTYGLSCAPFLAVRTMKQLAEDEGSRYPIGATAIKQDSYVDDIITGADSIPAMRETITQLHKLCMAGGFPLQKWATNIANLNDVIPQSCQSPAIQPLPHQIKGKTERKTWSEDTHPTLGLQWSPREDTFCFSITGTEDQPATKRGVVSKAAQLFDPLGWLTPVIVRAKITIQTTWLLTLDWDDPLPPTLANDWANFCAELPRLEEVRVPRPLFYRSNRNQREYHGFADASERAYGAVVYLRTRSAEDQWTTSLVTAKSKVAPIQQVSLPRLELCAAHLLAKLIQHTVTTLDMKSTPVHLWSDSTVALGWIQVHPSRWKTYVANRVADIQRRVPEAQWHHIAGANNPADCASRGISPTQLLDCTLWWKGPEFLQHNTNFTPVEQVNQGQLPEERAPVVAHAIGAVPIIKESELLDRFSSYTKLLRVTAWCQRWLRRRRSSSPSTFAASTALQKPQLPTLSATEIAHAEKCWIRKVQQATYSKEIQMISDKQDVASRSSLAPLAPILDSDNLLRVGGRLGKSMLSPDEAHPIILPPESRLTQLYVLYIHRTTLHGGVQATLGAVRQRFWIPKGRSIVKSVLHKCVICLRWRAEPAQQQMGELPACRVNPARPFHSTGVDYAGPIWLRTSPGRGHKAYKGFLAVFVCMVTKAAHLEAVSNYSAEAFLAAFRRFTSRRGLCAHLYSDCGTTFTGADQELRRLFTASTKENHCIRHQMEDLRIQWHFNPPAAPHFGGLWEAAVKSTKYHLRRTIGETKLTFEEMTTLLTQVEACLNSRPLTALTDDPSDLNALTPGHFLIGAALNAVPEPSLDNENINRLNRWQVVTHMRDQFWRRWQREYLHGITARGKWRSTKNNITPGKLCIMIDETTPPARWALARVTEVHPGADEKIRVAKVATATSEFTRPIHKLIVLPIDEKDQ